MGSSLKFLMTTNETIETEQPYFEVKGMKPICDTKRPRLDVCDVDGDIRVQGNLSTIFVVSNPNELLLEGNNIDSWNIKPYARKLDSKVMGKISTITIRGAQVSAEGLPECNRNYSIPAIVFSTGGYVGNTFHDFTDLLIPLYLTSIQFNGEVQFLVTDKRPYWAKKYRAVVQKLSNYEIIAIDHESEVLCFPRIIVGLESHKEFSIDASKSSYTMKDFRELLRSSYSLKRESVINLRNATEGTRPRLLVISRGGTRKLLNAEELAGMAERLGFEVAVEEIGENASVASQMVNSFDVLVGVHGAGLTNMVFLPENAVIIQIVPLGNMEGIARIYFEEPAKEMNLHYLEYKISINESSLLQKYSYDDPIFNDTDPYYKDGWRAFKTIFLDDQDVKLDIIRFRKVLLQALELLQRY
ncbi:hypothetical protein ACH5RR_024922 [Cinchona calisaya]|uniref:Glycosyltransferase 61 catalytic domain-containing protein n=1 Tax=Cinchona calisaya TaxID=153742 RepID=A0ABD2Z1J3_9GENT